MSIQGQILEVRVLSCRKLKDTELFTRQDPYVVIEYANTKHRTRTCTDGGTNPTFQEEKFRIHLVEGLREFIVTVWNSNTFFQDDFIGSGKVQLHRVLSEGYDDSSWPLQTRHMRAAGEVNLVMHFDNATKKHKPRATATVVTASYMPAAPPTAMPPPTTTPAYIPAAPPAVPYNPCPPPPPNPASYPSSTYPSPPAQQPYPPMAYPAANAYPTYPPPNPAAYPSSTYPSPPAQQPYAPVAYPPPAYLPTSYGQQYPPQAYEQQYPPPPAAQSYPPAPPPGYPPRPY